jgi:GNAT superfamily N-acetyltransferase
MQPRELDFAQQLARYRAYFPGPHLGMVVDSMLADNTAGALWNVQDTSAPLLVLWDRGNTVFYLSGDAERESPIEALGAAIAGELLPQARADGLRRFKVRALSPSLEENLPYLFPGVKLQPTTTRFAVHEATQQASVPPPRLSGVTLLAITPELLLRDDLGSIDAVREEIRRMWRSEARFNTHGLGTLAVLGNEIICFCTAEYVGLTYCGIGIATDDRYQCQGVATATAAAFVRDARARGLTPGWECDAANVASVRVAERAGFVWRTEEAYWSCYTSQQREEEADA